MINKNIKWLRNTFGISLKDLSKIVNITISSLSSYEERGIAPKYKTLLALWKFYRQAFDSLTLEEILEQDLSKLNKEIKIDFFQDQKSSNGYYTINEDNLTELGNPSTNQSDLSKILETIKIILNSDVENKELIILNLSEAIKRKSNI